MSDERMQILDMIEQGVISASEGARLLQAVRDQAEGDDPGDEFAGTSGEPIPEVIETRPPGDSPDPEFTASMERWKRWWMIPLWVGLGIIVVSSLWMASAYQAGGFSFWFACAWLPFLLGLICVGLAWSSRKAVWLHLRVQQQPGEWPPTIAFSFPLPLLLAAWLLRVFGRFIPQLKQTGIDEMILALGSKVSPTSPLIVDVEEGVNGERVQVYIG